MGLTATSANPLYLGHFAAFGLGSMASRTGFLILVAATVPFVYRLILREEADLLESQGEGYRRYFETVPRLWPSLRPLVPASGARPNWVDGFAGETFVWSFPIGMVVFDVTLRLVHFWVIMGAGLVVYFLAGMAAEEEKTGGTLVRHGVNHIVDAEANGQVENFAGYHGSSAHSQASPTSS